MFCYYGSWAGGRSGNGAFNVENINAKLCTHISYAFIGLNANGSVKLLDSGSMLYNSRPRLTFSITFHIFLDLFNRFINLKASNPNVKLLISMGGWNEGSATYSAVSGNSFLLVKSTNKLRSPQVAASKSRRATFVNSVYDFLIKYGFDGFDFDWEYPGVRLGSAPQDKVKI